MRHYKVEVHDAQIKPWLKKLQTNAIESAMDGAVEDVAKDAANQMSALAPVDTGLLRSSLRAPVSVEKDGEGTWAIRNLTEYTIRQNFEHRTKGGFVTRPFEIANALFVFEVRNAIRKVLE